MSLEIREIIQEIAREVIERDFGMPCRVNSYDEDTKTIDVTPINGMADFKRVRLRAEDQDGVLYVPSIGSVVLVEQTSADTAYVTMYGQIDSIQLLTGENGGLIKIEDLVQKLNNLENKVNELISYTASHTHPVTTAPGTSGPSLTPVVGNLTPTQVSDLENPDVTH